jgi:hypothetical protein
LAFELKSRTKHGAGIDRYVNIAAQLLTTSIEYGYYKYFISIRYSTIETKEVDRIGYNRFRQIVKTFLYMIITFIYTFS